jgi:hypothetical protein
MKQLILMLVVLAVALPQSECDPPPPDPTPDWTFYEVEIIHGYLLAQRGYCETMDQVKFQYAALWAHEELWDVWQPPASNLTEQHFSVQALRVFMQVDPYSNGVPVNGYYNPSEWFVVLRCGQELTLQHELRHAIMHQRALQLGITEECWKWVGHTYKIDCTPCVGCPPAW